MDSYRKLIFLSLVICFAQNLYAQLPVPYFNDFENGADQWSSYAILGTNDWELATPGDWSIDEPYSGDFAWVTNVNEAVSQNSIMALESPNFNLSTSDKHLILAFRSQFYFPTGANGLVEYSLDDGVTWSNLNADNTLTTGWYDEEEGFEGYNTNYADYLNYKYSLAAFGNVTQIKFRFVLDNSTSSGTRDGCAKKN